MLVHKEYLNVEGYDDKKIWGTLLPTPGDNVDQEKVTEDGYGEGDFPCTTSGCNSLFSSRDDLLSHQLGEENDTLEIISDEEEDAPTEEAIDNNKSEFKSESNMESTETRLEIYSDGAEKDQMEETIDIDKSEHKSESNMGSNENKLETASNGAEKDPTEKAINSFFIKEKFQ